MADGLGGPGGRFVGVAGGAGIGNFVFVGHRRSDEREGVRTNFQVGNFRGDFWHVAGNATAAGGTLLVVRVFFDGGGARTVERLRGVAVHADLIAGLSQLGVVIGAVDVVAGGAGNAAAIHQSFARNRCPACGFCGLNRRRNE